MDWPMALLLLFGTFITLLILGVPVAFAFLAINVVGIYLWWGGFIGLTQFIYSIESSIANFILIPVPLFILMGETLFHSGMGDRVMDAIDRWLGRLPGRLSLMAVGSGTLFSVLSGSPTASTAVLAATLAPEMEKRGYKPAMSYGPIVGSGGLAMLIPPSTLGVLIASLAYVSVGKFLIAIVIPGFIDAFLYGTYVITRGYLQPHLAPPYTVKGISLRDRVIPTVKYVLPLGLIVFLVTGVIFLGIATPSEAAALGAFGSFVLAFFYGNMTWEVIKKIMIGTISVTGMVFMIFAGAFAFSQVLAFTGATRGLASVAVNLPVSPILIIISMQVVLLIMGCFMEILSIMMVTIPIFLPVITTLGYNPLWFIAVMLLNLQMAGTTPPFGMLLYIAKGVAPPHITIGDIIRAALPFLVCDAITITLMIIFPQLVLWLPGQMW